MSATLLPTEPPILSSVPGSSIPKQVLWLAAPVVVEQALLYLVGLSDTLLTGWYLSVEHLAAVTTASYVGWFVGSLMMVVSAGATALVARLIGAGDRRGAIHYCGHSMVLAVVVGLAIAVVGGVSAPALTRALNLQGLAAIEAARYLQIVLAAAPLLACLTVGVACLRGAGDTRTGMWVMTLVNAINIALSWALVIGWGPFPALGLPGIALGTAVGEGTGGLVVLAILVRGRSGLVLCAVDLLLVPADVRRLLRISLPAAGESLTIAGCQLGFLGLINRLGPAASAAHGIALRCEAIAFLTLMGFAVAGGTLAGQYLGAGRPDLAQAAARTAWGMSVAASVALGALVFVLAPALFALFLRGRPTDVAELGVPVVRLVAFALPALATIQVLTGVLRGAGDTRWPWAIALFGNLLVRLPLAYWMILPTAHGGLGAGLYGAWIAMFADLATRGALLAVRFLRGGWRGVRV